MKFEILNEEEFRAFSEARDDYNLWQSVDMAELRKKEGFFVEFAGVRDDSGKILCGGMFSYRMVMGHRQYYSPRGFLIDWNDRELVRFFLQSFASYAKAHKGLSLRVDPYVPLKARDLDGNAVEGGFDNTWLVELMQELGFRHHGYTRGIDLQRECRWIYTIPLKGRTLDEMLESFERKTRRSVQKTIKYRIYTKELDESNIDEFIKVMESTSERRQFENRTREYYIDLLRIFGKRGHLKYLSAIADIDVYIEELEKDAQKEKDTIAECDAKLAVNPNSAKMTKKKAIAQDVLAQYEKHIAEAQQMKAEKGKEITLSSGVFFINKNEILCLFSGVYEEYMQFASPYAMHWQMMKYGIEHGIGRYNLYGISGIFDESADDWGVYLFKKGFMGEVVELVGEFECDYTPLNRVYHFLSRIKNHG